MKSKKESLQTKHIKLKEKLLNEGYYVQIIGQQSIIEYLIVSCREPKNNIKNKSN